MKKFLLSLICILFAALGATAQTYTDRLVVTVNGESSEPMQATVIYTDNGNGTCNFSLPNFVLGSGEEAIPVGNINIENIPVSAPVNGISSFEFKGDITIAAGDDPTKDFWFGPELGVLPLDLKGKVSAEKIYVSIGLDLVETLEQIVYVQFGDPNFNAVKYTDNLVVTVNGESSEPQQTTVIFNDNGDGTCNFLLPNFALGQGDEAIPVGNIDIQNIPFTAAEGGLRTFEFKGDITIAAGDDPTKEFWFGPELGVLPLDLKGKVSADKIYVSINLDLMEMMEQIVYVQFGDDNFPTGPVAGEKSGIYLRGSFNDWGTTDEAEFLTTSVAGVYEIKDLTFANGSDGFKVADAKWDAINFGGNGALTIGQPYTLVAGGGNIKLPTANEYKCSVITLDMNAKTLTIVGEEGGKVVENVDFIILAGTPEFIGADWDPTSDAGRMSETTNVAAGGNFRTFEWSKVGVPAGEHQFKFTANGSWSISWGVADEFAFDQEIQSVRGGDNIYFKLAEAADLKVELTVYPADLANAKYKVTNLTVDGIETIVAEGSVNLYDLQGRSVRRAQNGVVISAGRKMINK